MGAWGTGVYDNDSAADWAHELGGGGLSMLEEGLKQIQADTYLDSWEGTAAIAAADVVARLRSGGGEQSAYVEGVTDWVQANRNVEWQQLVAPAIASIDRASSPDNNELYELWAETDLLQEWLAVLGEVRSRLTQS